ncbi:PQQ-dependent sugar dehydrogenase [Anatilimnocola aggregata]|uniref:PQQ-dependent sugar dehydrogenase n=1 Tax=Anatilimnocola aggregata TaxID=2528021 RepID=UPI00192E566F|nr:PQQ-dependent sugar dehydrogenase [Anatilimnocola aggregata]
MRFSLVGLPYTLAMIVSFINCCMAVAQPAAAKKSEFGLEKRVPWTTSRLTGAPQPPSPYLVERVFPSLSFNEPCEMVAIPGTNRLALIEVKGKIFTFENKPTDEKLTPDLFADVTQFDKNFFRVYGIAFHPQFTKNRYCYISYVLNGRTPEGSRVSRFKVTDTDPPKLDPKSEQTVITWLGGGHNGAHMHFGPDGMLYISTGDGGDSFPPDGHNTGQDVSDLLASILRIDVDQADEGKAYRIPADNPLVNTPNARGEIWAYGVRNPWKMCFDPADGSLWVGDVGWELWEMIYRIERGGNYGWSLMEGRQPVHRERQRGPSPILPPTVEHDHTEARSITGGYFSQTDRLPELRGAYVYGDYVTGKMWGVRHQNGKVTWKQELVDTPVQIVSFGLDHAGEVYIIDYAGTLLRLKENPRRGVNSDFPKTLSATGLFVDVAKHQPAAGVIPYSINSEPWADGTTAERFVALKDQTQLSTYKKTDVQMGWIKGEFEFPSDGVLVKTVSLEMEAGNPKSHRRLETQVLHYDVDTWKAYNYIWNDEQTDAILAPDESRDRTLSIRDKSSPNGQSQQTWHHASRTECILCHTTRAASIHGFRLPQLNREQDYASVRAPQLATLNHIGLFAEPLPANVDAWPNIHDAQADLDARARAYLHVNCAHCHRRGGGGSASFDVQFDIPFDTTRLNTRPTQGTFGIHGAQVVAPGDPYRSVLYYRLAKLGHGRMPQFGSNVVDAEGVKLIHDWIASLPPANDDPVHKTAERARNERAGLLKKALGSQDAAAAGKSLQSLLSSSGSALQLIAALDREPIARKIKDQAVELGNKVDDPLVRDLFERYLPEEQRVKRLGTVIRPDDILALPGNAARGKYLFLEAASVQCRNCHRVGIQGKEVGPDLTAIGKKLDRAKLLENILEPSKTIDPKYVTSLVETVDGRVLAGVLISRSDKGVLLRGADGKDTTIAAADVEQFATQQKSIMPELLLKEMTAAQVADLLEYLSSLK